MRAPTPKEVRQARAFLFQRGIFPSTIHPRAFAAAAKEQRLTFFDLLKVLHEHVTARESAGEQYSQANPGRA